MHTLACTRSPPLLERVLKAKEEIMQAKLQQEHDEGDSDSNDYEDEGDEGDEEGTCTVA